MRIVTDDFAALCANEPELADLRASVRDFLVADRVEFGWTPSVDAWLSSWDEEFSARLGDAGFLGLTIPREYGGQGLSHLHRYVVTEELLAAGAPVARTGSPTVRSRPACWPTVPSSSGNDCCRKSLRAGTSQRSG